MKTFKQHINEKLVAVAKDVRLAGHSIDLKEPVEIYKNPTHREFLSILDIRTNKYKTVRLWITKYGAGDVYAFRGDYLHMNAANLLKSKGIENLDYMSASNPDLRAEYHIGLKTFTPYVSSVNDTAKKQIKNAVTNKKLQKALGTTKILLSPAFRGMLDEKWLRQVQSIYSPAVYDIFKNPSKREFAEVAQNPATLKSKFVTENLRALVADYGRGDFYIFNEDLLHHEALFDLKLDEENTFKCEYVGKKSAKRLVIYGIGRGIRYDDEFPYETKQEVMKQITKNSKIKYALPSGTKIELAD